LIAPPLISERHYVDNWLFGLFLKTW